MQNKRRLTGKAKVIMCRRAFRKPLPVLHVQVEREDWDDDGWGGSYSPPYVIWEPARVEDFDHITIPVEK